MVIACTSYGNVIRSRGPAIPPFIERIKNGQPITIANPNMTRFLMNLDVAVELVEFAFHHAEPGDLFIQKSPASTIGNLAVAVQRLFGETDTHIIGTRHGEKSYETLMTSEGGTRSKDVGHYFRVVADVRDLNYDKYVEKGDSENANIQPYTSDNTERLDVNGVVKKVLTADYVQQEFKNRN